jgi:methyl-accepting chemotaxis protein
MFDQEVDMWVLDDGNNNFNLQDPFGMEYYETDIDWYNEPINNKNSLWTDPYESEGGGLITSYVAPVMKNGEAIALVGMDLYLDDIGEKLQAIKMFDTGYLYVLDKDGNVIYHPRVDFGTNMLDAGNFSEVLKNMQSSDAGFTSYKRDDGKIVVSAFAHLENGWIVSSSVPEEEVLKIINSVIVILIGIGLFMIVVSIIIGKLMGRSISNPILKVVSATEKIKAGDFTVSVDIKTSDETKLLGDGLNEMVASVRNLITKNNNVSREMLDSASNLAAMSEETTATIDQVAKTIDEITKGSQDTAKDAEKGAIVAIDIDTKFNSLIENSNVMKQNADDAINVNKEGLEVLDNLRKKSDLSKVSNEKVTTAIKNLDNRVGEITNIISTISSIAEQTNLLALNASIEAARAGEAGRGFAVVADEIRKLAEDSGKSTDEIKDIVTSIQRESEDTVKVMKEVSGITNEQNMAVGEVMGALNKIFESVEKITAQIEFVDNELNELGVSKNALVEVVSNISSVSEETAAATEEVNASMMEQANAVEQVAENAERLNELSYDLNKQIEMFKI